LDLLAAGQLLECDILRKTKSNRVEKKFMPVSLDNDYLFTTGDNLLVAVVPAAFPAVRRTDNFPCFTILHSKGECTNRFLRFGISGTLIFHASGMLLYH
jgi:hypothetical protein